MPQISEETKQQVLAATDIVDLIGSYISVRRAGTNFTALCPFHNEKSPSFNINPARQFFHCFGCKKSGDAITFVRDYENLPFADAVRKLADRAGIVVKEEITDPREDQARRQRGRLLDINREAAAFMHRLLMRSRDEAQHARDYLKSRGFGKETAERWTIGWAPARVEILREWAREKGYNGRELVDAGLLGQGDRGAYPRFRDRLMFPIRDDLGEVVAFSGRQLHAEQGGGKYVNSPETALFKKSNVLFALDRARRNIIKQQAVIICEGQLDAIACHESGVENVIAVQGSAFTAQHAKLLHRYAARTAILCFDSDNAGFEGAMKAFRQAAPENIALKMIRMPAGDDPDSFLRKNGAEAFQELVSRAPDFFDALMDRATEQGRTATPEGRAQLQQEYASLLSLIADPMMRDALVNKVSTRLRGGSSELRGAVAREGQQAARRQQQQSQRPGRTGEEAGPAPLQPAYLDPTVGYLCGLALHSMAAQEWLGEQFETIHEASEYLQGVPVLEAILSGRPDPSSPASVNAFLSGLPEDQRLALYADPTFHSAIPEDLIPVAEQTLAELSAKYLMSRDARVKADLAQAVNDPVRMIELLEEVKEIEGLLGGLKQRFTFDERYTSWKKQPKRFENSKFPRGKRERNS